MLPLVLLENTFQYLYLLLVLDFTRTHTYLAVPTRDILTLPFLLQLSLLMHRRVPSLQKLKNTFLGILQSTAFLTANAFGYSLSLCFLR